MSAHPGSQCAKCGMDVHGEELCGWCEADVLRAALEEARRERDEARADAYEKVQALAAVSGILLGRDVPSTWDCYGAVADARKCARERDEEAK